MCSFIGTGHENRAIIKYSAASLITGAGNHSTSCFCVYCEKKHPTWKCNTVTEVRSRKSILRSKGRCYLCLQTGHISRFCTSKYRCAKCQGRHNVSICEPKWKSEKTDSQEIANNVVVKDSRNDSNNYCTSNDIGSKKNDFVQISNNIVESKKGQTFLMTAKGLVANEPMNRQQKVHVLFDQCAQKSFITEKVAGYLKLPCKRKEKMVVNAFGGTENQIVEYDIVQVSIMDLLWVTNLNGLPHSLLSYGHLIPGEHACTGRTCLIKKFFQGPSKGRYIPWAVPEDSGYWLNGVLRGWSANG